MVDSATTNFVPLEDLLAVERDPLVIVGLKDDEIITWGQWRERVDGWRHVISECSEQRFAVFHADALEFSAIIFALWAEQRVAIVPGNSQPITVEQLVSKVDGFIGDFSSTYGKIKLSLTASSPSRQFESIQLSPRALVLEVFTSGSSGEPEAIPKFLSQLSNEVSNLQLLWGDLISGASLFATVSHHHIYGLLFRVLWPLAVGRPFNTTICEYLEDINYRAKGWDSVVVISSPTHLSRLPPLTDWSVLKSRCRAIFSSGAPLSRSASLETQALLDIAPIEVYGSSETGGIAWRQQSSAIDSLWQVVLGIKIETETETGCLRIQSPYLADDNWYITSDRVKIEKQDQFRLQGRVDNVVKIEGKRVSLSEMEKRLEQHELVDSARLIILAGKRTAIGAVVVLTKSGREQFSELGKRTINNIFSEHLIKQFERPVLPRRWRYPEQLPNDTQGKVPHRSLLTLFDSTQPTRPTLPEVITVEKMNDEILLELRIPEDLLYFDGHFASVAILPGVVQVHWAEHFGREYFGSVESGYVGDFFHLEAIKFMHVIRPNSTVQLTLKFTANNGKLHFSYRSSAGNHSSGRFVENCAIKTDVIASA